MLPISAVTKVFYHLFVKMDELIYFSHIFKIFSQSLQFTIWFHRKQFFVVKGIYFLIYLLLLPSKVLGFDIDCVQKDHGLHIRKILLLFLMCRLLPDMWEMSRGGRLRGMASGWRHRIFYFLPSDQLKSAQAAVLYLSSVT